MADIIVEVYPPKAEEFWAVNEPYTSVLARIKQVRFKQEFGAHPVLWPSPGSRGGGNSPVFDVLNAARERFKWGTEQLKRVQRVAQTIAALADAPLVRVEHMTEAVLYRVPLADE